MTVLPERQTDLSIFAKLGLEVPPVGVKFLFDRPEGVPRLEGNLALCEMVANAQAGNFFYADQESHECVGPMVLGHQEVPPFLNSGQLGPCLEIFNEPRANERLWQNLPKLPLHACQYVVFAPLERVSFEPDVLVVQGTARQAEIVLRSMACTTGQLYEGRTSIVVGCAFTLVYPYLTGKMNFSVLGLTYGHIARKIGHEDAVEVSIPWDCFPTVIANLKTMPWVLPAYTDQGREALYRSDKYSEEKKPTPASTLLPTVDEPPSGEA